MTRRTDGQPPERDNVGAPPKIGKGAKGKTPARDEATEENVIGGPGTRTLRPLKGRKVATILEYDEDDEDEIVPPPAFTGEKFKVKVRGKTPAKAREEKQAKRRPKETEEEEDEDEDADIEAVRQGLAEAKLDDEMSGVEGERSPSPAGELEEMTELIRNCVQTARLVLDIEELDNMASNLEKLRRKFAKAERRPDTVRAAHLQLALLEMKRAYLVAECAKDVALAETDLAELESAGRRARFLEAGTKLR